MSELQLTLSQAQALNFTILFPDGSEFVGTLGVADLLLYQYMQTGAIVGCAIGVIITLMVLLTLAARSYKNFMFWMYQTCFCFALVSYSIILRQYMEPDHNITASLLEIPISSYANNLGIAGNFFSLLLVFSLTASLIFQVYTAYKDYEGAIIKSIVASLVFLACCQTAVIWIWQLVVNTKDALDPYSENSLTSNWTASALWPSFAATAMTCSLILSARLYIISRSRAKLGLNQFDTIKVIMIVSVQNGTIPGLFAILYSACSSVVNFPESIGIMTTMLCCAFYPVGYIWSQTTTGNLSSRDSISSKRKISKNKDNGNPMLVMKNSAYWNGGMHSAASRDSEEDYEESKVGDRYRTQLIE